MHAKNCDGYNSEFREAMTALIQVLFSSIRRPEQTVIQKLNLYDHQEEGKGFLFVPRHVPHDIVNDGRMTVDVIEKSERQFYASFPRWSTGQSYSQASVFLWRNAVSMASTPFGRGPSIELADVSAMIASSEPFSFTRVDGAALDQYRTLLQ